MIYLLLSGPNFVDQISKFGRYVAICSIKKCSELLKTEWEEFLRKRCFCQVSHLTIKCLFHRPDI